MKIIKGGQASNNEEYKHAFAGFIGYFVQQFGDLFEDLHLAVIAWNMGNIKTLELFGYDKILESSKSNLLNNKKELELFNQMVDYKVTHYIHLPLFIKDIVSVEDSSLFNMELVSIDEFLNLIPKDLENYGFPKEFEGFSDDMDKDEVLMTQLVY